MDSRPGFTPWHREVLAIDAWRSPQLDWDLPVVLDLLASHAVGDSVDEAASEILRRILPRESAWDAGSVKVSPVGAVLRPTGSAMRADVLAWALECVWGELDLRQRLVDGHVIARVRTEASGATGHLCIPLRPEKSGQTLIACALTGSSQGEVLRLGSRLTLLSHLIHVSCPPSRDDAVGEEALRRSDAELTPRQRRILAGMAQGFTNRQIAAHIAYSESTVRLESIAIYRFFGVHSRFQAVAAAREAGLLLEPGVPVGA